MFGATTGHMVTPTRPFNPKCAVGALFKFAAFHILKKHGLMLVYFYVTRLVLFASLPFVKVNPTSQTVLAFAAGTAKFRIFAAIIRVNKCVLAVCSWTPAYVFVLINYMLKRKGTVFLVQFLG